MIRLVMGAGPWGLVGVNGSCLVGTTNGLKNVKFLS